MVKIRMLSDDRGSPNGYEVVEYAAGEVYDVSEGLADAFVLQRRSATLLAGEKVAAPVLDEAPTENEATPDDGDPEAPAPKKRAKKKADPGE